jgi:uncharacterized repeat protein (TIGR03803 family)
MRYIGKMLHRSAVWLRAPAAMAFVICGATAYPAFAHVTETVLYSFLASNDGSGPSSPVIADLSGPNGTPRALYGTTGYAGALNNPNCFGPGCGTVFKLTPTAYGQMPWTETTLWDFSGGSDSSFPYAGLFAKDEHISQTTSLYGTTTGLNSGGLGTVFKLTGQTLTTIYSFTGGSDGSTPVAAVIADEAAGVPGALYGTATGGGTNGCGTVYRLLPPKSGQSTWTEQTLWTFLGGSDGCFPSGSLLVDERGALYGTTYKGGGNTNANCIGPGCGTVFKLSPPEAGRTNWKEQILWSFTGGSDGGAPFTAGLTSTTGARFMGRRNWGAPQTMGLPSNYRLQEVVAQAGPSKPCGVSRVAATAASQLRALSPTRPARFTERPPAAVPAPAITVSGRGSMASSSS